MSLIIVAFTVLVVLAGTYLQNLKIFDNGKVLSSIAQETSVPTPTPTTTSTATAKPHLNSSVSPVPTQTPFPANPSNNSDMSGYIYPGSDVLSSSGNSLDLTSQDSTDKITDWYKQKLQSKNFNANSFVTTKANDKVLNKLVSSNGQTTINIEISQDVAGSLVKISVKVTI